MPTVPLTFPDGSTAPFTYPEGASEEQIAQRVREVKAMWQRLNAEPEVPPVEPSGPSMQEYVEQMPKPQRADVALVGGLVNVANQLGNIVGLVPDWRVEQHKEFMAPLHETPSGQIGRVAGEMAATAPIGGGLGGLAARMAPKLFPPLAGWTATGGMRSIGAGAGRGAIEGAAEGAILAGPGERGTGALEGGGLGAAVGGMLPAMMRGVVRPEPEARTLMEAGLDITPGHMAPESTYGTLEQSLTSIPPFKSLVTKAREAPQDDLTELIINRSVPPGYGRVQSSDKNAMLAEAYSAFRPAYDSLKDFLVGAPESGQLRQVVRPTVAGSIADDITSAASYGRVAASDSTRKGVRTFLNDVTSKLKTDQVKTGDLIDIRSDIRDEARMARFGGTPDLDKARLLDQAEEAVTRHINQHMPEELVEFNRKLDSQYANYKVAEKAIYKARNREFPTMSQWDQAIRESTPQKDYAHGGGRFRDIINAAQRSFRSTNPSTGQRLLNWALLGGTGTGGYQAAMNIDPMALLAAAVPITTAAVTPGGRRAAAGMLRPQRAAQAMAAQWPGMAEGAGVMARSMLPVYMQGE